MSIGLEWILTAVVAIVGSLVGVVWAMLNKRVDAQGDKIAESARHLQSDIEKQEKTTQDRFADVWGHINKLRDDTVEIKEMRGALTSKIEGIETRIGELPSHKDFYNMLRESEERIETRLVALLRGAKGA